MNKFMSVAISEANIALSSSEVPVGAVIVKDGQIIAKAHNLKESKCDPTAHAEILAIQKATSLLRDWRLIDCDIYVTLEPCPMCASAIKQARLRRLYFGAYDKDQGAAGSCYDLVSGIEVYSGIMEDACSDLLNSFFKQKR